MVSYSSYYIPGHHGIESRAVLHLMAPTHARAGPSTMVSEVGISVRWINMVPDVARASRMHALMDRVKTQALADQSARLDVARFDAVVPTCPNRGGMCTLGVGASYYSAQEVYGLETQKARLHQESRVRAALMGVWLSYISAFKRFSVDKSVNRPPYLIVMEDDAGISTSFFRWLPALIAPIPKDFHVIRFSCWGARFEEDRIAPDVYRAAHHPFSTNTSDPAGFLHGHPWIKDRGFAYGGAHVTLVQRATVDELIQHLLGIGVIPFDLSIRESVQGHNRPHALNTTAGHDIAVAAHRKIRSYVVDTSLAWDDRTASTRTNATREWRVPSSRAGSNKAVGTTLAGQLSDVRGVSGDERR